MRILSLAFVAVSVLSLAHANAATIAYNNSTTMAALQDAGDYNLGLDFHVNTPIFVTELGAFDNGLIANLDGAAMGALGVDVGIFDLATGMLVGSSVHFSSSSPGTPLAGDAGGDSFKAVNITLQTGDYSIVAFNSDDYNSGGIPIGNPNSTSAEHDGGGLISFEGSGRYGPGTSLGYPTIIDNGPNNRYDAGTFAFTTTPEPTAISLYSLAMISLGMAARRSWRRQAHHVLRGASILKNALSGGLRMKTFLAAVLSFVLFGAVSAAQAASFLAYSAPAMQAPDQVYNLNVGMDFVPGGPIEVTQLGLYSGLFGGGTGTGFSGDDFVTLFNSSDAVLAQLEFGNGTGNGTLVAGTSDYVKPLTTPVFLTEGNTYTIAAFESAGPTPDGLANTANGATPPAETGLPYISYVGSGRYNGTGGSTANDFPNIVDVGPANHYDDATFVFVPVPEPSSLVALGGLAAMGLFAVRRRHRGARSK
jgi:hypothetical protein